MNDPTHSITFGGIGGQGILKASEICGWAALFAGYHVKTSEVHGMAQRGGSVESHVRFGKKVRSPLVPMGGADFLVCFHHDEHPRLQSFLKEGGVDLTSYLDSAEQVIDNPRCLNTCLVGVLSAKLPIRDDSWMKAIERVFKPPVVAENRKVFRAGRRIGQS